MTAIGCHECRSSKFRLGSSRLSMTVEVVCDGCERTVAEFSQRNFIEEGETSV